jgi:hypothetical protein
MTKVNDEDYEDDEDDEPYIKKCSQQSRKLGKRCISLSDCRYDIVRFACQYLDWRDCERVDHIKLFWTDNPPSYDTLIRLNRAQVMSRFPGMNELCRFIK